MADPDDKEADAALESSLVLLQEAEELTSQNYSYDHVWNKAHETFLMAKQALVGFRRRGVIEGRKKALDVVVKAKLLMGDNFDALQFAQDELAMVKRTLPDDKASHATLMEMVLNCLIVRNDGVGALEMSGQLYDLQTELQSSAGQAKALQFKANGQILAGKFKEAVEAAESAMKVFKELKDTPEQDATARILSRAYCERGSPDRAPNREAALRALEALQAALADTNNEAWSANFTKLTDSGAYLQRDLDDMIMKVVKPAPEDYRKSMLAFLEFHFIDTTPYGGRQRSFATEVGNNQQYLTMRVSGGMGYGPSYRVIRQSNLIGVEDEAPKYCGSVIQVEDSHLVGEGWEKDILYHPGILEGMIQTGNTMKLF